MAHVLAGLVGLTACVAVAVSGSSGAVPVAAVELAQVRGGDGECQRSVAADSGCDDCKDYIDPGEPLDSHSEDCNTNPGGQSCAPYGPVFGSIYRCDTDTDDCGGNRYTFAYGSGCTGWPDYSGPCLRSYTTATNTFVTGPGYCDGT